MSASATMHAWAAGHDYRCAWLVECLNRHTADDWGDLDPDDRVSPASMNVSPMSPMRRGASRFEWSTMELGGFCLRVRSHHRRLALDLLESGDPRHWIAAEHSADGSE